MTERSRGLCVLFSPSPAKDDKENDKENGGEGNEERMQEDNGHVSGDDKKGEEQE